MQNIRPMADEQEKTEKNSYFNMFYQVLLKFVMDRFNLDLEEQKRVFFEIDSNAVGGKEYYGMVVLSSLIATLGLLNNSTAVIIGAMIVAPLLNPTMAISMGIVRGDLILVHRSLKSLMGGVVLGCSIAYVTAALFPIIDVYQVSEILARTQPNLIDMGVALAAGAAGAYAVVHKKISTSIAGVAIAVALMPPLAVTGIGIKLGDMQIASGAAIMCLSNLAGINLASILIFSLTGFTSQRPDESKKEFFRHSMVSLSLVMILFIPTASMYTKTLNQQLMEKKINQMIQSHVKEIDFNAVIQDKPKWNQKSRTVFPYIALHDREQNTKVTYIEVTVHTPSLPDTSFPFQLRALLEESLKTPVDLRMLFVPTTEYTNRGYIRE